MVSLGVEIVIHNNWVQVQIDQREVWAEKGAKDFVRLERDMAVEAQATAIKGIERRAREGDILAAAPEGKARETIAEIAWNNSFHEYEINIDVLPKQRPQINFSGGLVITTYWTDIGKQIDIRR